MAENKKMSTKDVAIALGLSLAVIFVLAVVICVTNIGHAVDEEAEVFPVEELSEEVIELEAVVEEVEEEVEAEAEVVEEVVEEPVAEPVAVAAPVNYSYVEPAYSEPVYTENGSGLTKSGGVNWHNGRRETWYSSSNPNSYHYRTGEWTVGEDGVYRDADGYVVVAAGDYELGSTVDTSFGEGKVYDYCGTPGTTDVYVNW